MSTPIRTDIGMTRDVIPEHEPRHTTLCVAPAPIDEPDPAQLRRNAVVGGLIHEYRLVA
jgi:hypothetical protein